jgi:hypothetical protein
MENLEGGIEYLKQVVIEDKLNVVENERCDLADATERRPRARLFGGQSSVCELPAHGAVRHLQGVLARELR